MHQNVFGGPLGELKHSTLQSINQSIKNHYAPLNEAQQRRTRQNL